MNIDERLEALTQTVEIMAGMQRASEERMANMELVMTKLGGTMTKLEVAMTKLTDTMNRLGNIVIRHE